MTTPETLSYPVGRYDFDLPADPGRHETAVRTLAELPRTLSTAVSGLTEEQLDTPYRPGGWTVRQLVHHVADSHLNALLRCKWALTEDEPAVKTYDQERWAELPDTALPVGVSLRMLDAVHRRWDALWRALDDAALERAFRHPDHGRLTLRKMADWYAWHSRHHVAHVTALREREGW